MAIRRTITFALIVSLLTACAPGSTVSLDRKPGEVSQYEGKHRIRMKDGSEYITHTFSVSDSVLVIKWLDSSDARFASTTSPISLRVSEVSTVESLSKTPSTLGLIILGGCAAVVVGLTLWIAGQFAD